MPSLAMGTVLGQLWLGCHHALLPAWVTIPSLQEQTWNRHVPLTRAQLLSCEQLCICALFMGHSIPPKRETAAGALLHPRTPSHPNLGWLIGSDLGPCSSRSAVSGGVGHGSSCWHFGLGLIPEKEFVWDSFVGLF